MAGGASPLSRAAPLGHVRRGGTVKKGDRHRVGGIRDGVRIYPDSEPVPFFHSTKSTSQISRPIAGGRLYFRSRDDMMMS